MTASQPSPVDADQIERAERVAEAIHSTEMEGLSVDTHTLSDADEYIAGRISVDELVARAEARYGLA